MSKENNFFLTGTLVYNIYVLEISTKVAYGQRSVLEHEYSETYENT